MPYLVLHLLVSAAAFIALTDFASIASRNAQFGTSSYADVFILAPLFSQTHAEPPHSQTGLKYIHNAALASFLQSFGQPRHIVTLRVDPGPIRYTNLTIPLFCAMLFYNLGMLMTADIAAVLFIIQDWWGLGTVAMILVSRWTNIVIARRRIEKSPPVKDGRLNAYAEIFMRGGRWICLCGRKEDIEAVTTSRSLREKSTMEGFAIACTSLLVFAATAFAGNISPVGSWAFIFWVLSSIAFFRLSKLYSRHLEIFDRIVTMDKGAAEPLTRQMDASLRNMVEGNAHAVDCGLTTTSS